MFAQTPPPPYYAVVFSSVRTPIEDAAYRKMSDRMVELARQQPGFLGVESARGADGLGITVSYWSDMESIANWKANTEHLVAQRLGKERWYQSYQLWVCRVEKA